MNTTQPTRCQHRNNQGHCAQIAKLRVKGMLSPSIFYDLTLANAKQCEVGLQGACKHFAAVIDS